MDLGNGLPGDRAKLAEIVSRHLATGSQTEADLRTRKSGWNTEKLDRCSVARVVRRDVPASTGIIQVIDRLAKA